MDDSEIWKNAEKRFRRSSKSWGSTKRISDAKELLKAGFKGAVEERVLNGQAHTFSLSLVPTSDPQKKRPICVPSVADFATQCWMYEKISSSCKVSFPSTTYGVHYHDPSGSKVVKGCHRCVKDILTTRKSGYKHGFETDLVQFYPTIDRGKLKQAVEKHLGVDILRLLEPVIDFEISSKEHKNSPDFATYFDRKGVAQGGVLSPFLANLLLLDFDRSVAKFDSKVFRYVDDLILVSRTAKQRDLDSQRLCEFLNRLNLAFHDPGLENTKTKNFGTKGRFRFLGFDVLDKDCMPSAKARALLLERLVALTLKEGTVLEFLGKANNTVLGWYLYFGILWEGPNSHQYKMDLQNKLNKVLSEHLVKRNLPELSGKNFARLGVAQFAELSRSESFLRLRSKFPMELQLKLIEDSDFGGSEDIESAIVKRI